MDMTSQKLVSVVARVLAFALAIAFSPAVHAGTYKVLYTFGSMNDGSLPAGSVVLDKKGNLYGATYGGDNGCKGGDSGGTIFELTPDANGTWTESVLYCFSGQWTDGFPDSGLVFDRAGLYGTAAGGPNGMATVFRLGQEGTGWDLNTLYDFGAGPGVLLDSVGDIFGYMGPGVYKAGAVAVLAPGSNGWTYTELYSFGGNRGIDGWGPVAPPNWDAHGNLYGTTLHGGNSYSSGSPKSCRGSSGCGVAFQMTLNANGTWSYNVLHRFANFETDGQYPYAGLVVDASGTAYGATAFGGAYGNGTIFKLRLCKDGHWKQTVLYGFPNCAEGCVPSFTLVFDKLGNLYGSSGGGNPDCGNYTCGTVFKLSPQKNGKWKYTALHKFNGADGAFPYGVIVDRKGNIFGTTEHGGTYNAGVAFEITRRNP
jgi:hypothetical protein